MLTYVMLKLLNKNLNTIKTVLCMDVFSIPFYMWLIYNSSISPYLIPFLYLVWGGMYHSLLYC